MQISEGSVCVAGVSAYYFLPCIEKWSLDDVANHNFELLVNLEIVEYAGIYMYYIDVGHSDIDMGKTI